MSLEWSEKHLIQSDGERSDVLGVLDTVDEDYTFTVYGPKMALAGREQFTYSEIFSAGSEDEAKARAQGSKVTEVFHVLWLTSFQTGDEGVVGLVRVETDSLQDALREMKSNFERQLQALSQQNEALEETITRTAKRETRIRALVGVGSFAFGLVVKFLWP